MNTKEKIITGIAIVALLVAVFMGGKQGPQGPQGPKGDTALGSTPTLDGVDLGKFKIGGVEGYFWSQPLTPTSTTICTIKPYALFTASSTLIRLGVRVTSNGDLAAQELNIATSTNTGGTTTPSVFRALTIPVGQSYSMYDPSSTTTVSRALQFGTQNNGQSDILFGPNDILNFRRATSSPQTQSSYWQGLCWAEFRRL